MYRDHLLSIPTLILHPALVLFTTSLLTHNHPLLILNLFLNLTLCHSLNLSNINVSERPILLLRLLDNLGRVLVIVQQIELCVGIDNNIFLLVLVGAVVGLLREVGIVSVALVNLAMGMNKFAW